MFNKNKLSSFEEAALKILQQEAVHPMGVHVKEVPGKKVDGLPAFKVTKVGSKVKEHGGIKVGEHIHDNHIDDLVDMGHKIKTEEVEQIDEKYVDEHQDKSTHYTVKGKPAHGMNYSVDERSGIGHDYVAHNVYHKGSYIGEIHHGVKDGEDDYHGTYDPQGKEKEHKSHKEGIDHLIRQHTAINKKFPQKKIKRKELGSMTRIQADLSHHGENGQGDRHFKEEVEQVDEMDMTHSDPEKHAKSKKYHYDLGKKTAMAGKEKGETSDSYGPYASDYEAGYHSVGPNKFKPIKKEENEMDENTQQKTLADYVADHITQDFDRRTGRNTEQVEEEQLDELSPKTLGSYAKQAGKEASHMAAHGAGAYMMGASKEAKLAADKSEKRTAGVKRATDKLVKKATQEDVDQVEEGALGTGIGAVTGAAMGGPVGAAAGGLAGHLVQKGLQKVGRKIKAGYQAMKKQEEVEQPVHETIEYHNEYDIKIADEYTYDDFVKAAIEVTDGSEDAIAIAEDYFNRGDISIIIEQFTRSDIQDKISAHKKAGSSVTMPKYTTKDDKMHAEYTVTDKKGMRRRHIHHGNISKVENLGKVNVSPDDKD